MTDAEQITTIAHSISDFGFLVVAGGTFILLSSAMMIAVFVWFRNIINNTLNAHKATMDELLVETRAQNETLAEISEGLRPETLMRIKSTAGAYFDLSVVRVCDMIKRIRKENHISDRSATSKKIRALLRNIHEDRNSRFDNYTYRGKRLSTYTNTEWIEQVAVVVENEIYDTSGENDSRAYTNISTVYENIKLDFYRRLK